MRGGVVKRGRSTRSHVPCVGRDNDGGMRPKPAGISVPDGSRTRRGEGWVRSRVAAAYSTAVRGSRITFLGTLARALAREIGRSELDHAMLGFPWLKHLAGSPTWPKV